MITDYAEVDNAEDRIKVLGEQIEELERSWRRVGYAPHRRVLADEIARARHAFRTLSSEVERFYEEVLA
jgi:hypothetical protein